MSVTYKFTSLSSLADYLSNRGRELGERAKRAKPKEAALLKREAYATESVADLIRNTVIEPEQVAS